MLVRILTAVVGLPLLLAVVFLLPPVATAILFALACMIAAYEMLWRTGLLKQKRIVVYTALMAARSPWKWPLLFWLRLTSWICSKMPNWFPWKRARLPA